MELERDFTDLIDAWEDGHFDGNPEELLATFKEFMTHHRRHLTSELDVRTSAFLEAGRQLYMLERKMMGEGVPPDVLLAWDLMGMGVQTRAKARQYTRSERACSQSPPALAVARLPSPPTPEEPHPLSPEEPLSPSRRKRPAEEEESEADDNAYPTLEVLETRQRYLNRFKTSFREEVVAVRGMAAFDDPEQAIHSLFDTVIERQREIVGAKGHDRCILEISGNEQDKAVWFSLRRVDQLNGHVVADKLGRIIQSNQSFMTDGVLQISYIHISTPEAGGRTTIKPNQSMKSWLEDKLKSFSLFDPQNTHDSMCLTRAVALGIAHKTVHKHAFTRLKHPKSRILKKQSEDLCALAGIDPQRACDIDDLKKLQDVLLAHRLVVFTDQYGEEIVFKGPISTLVHPRKNVYLLWHESHFYCILRIKACFPCSHYCENCLLGYNNLGNHMCRDSCWRCMTPNCHDETEQLMRCNDCGRHFAGQACFDCHKEVGCNGESTCERKKYCSKCDTTYVLGKRGKRRKVHHKCGEMTCHYCKLTVQENH